MRDRPPSRRHALLMAGGAGAMALGTAAPAEARCPGVKGFRGTWDGNLDGRRARLTVHVARSARRYLVRLRLTDLDRGAYFTADVQDVPRGARSLEGVTLAGDRGTVVWPVLHLHTRTGDVLSGRGTRGGGPDHGVCFHRAGTGPAYVSPARPFVRWEDWFGSASDSGYGLPGNTAYAWYDGSHDGRRASLRAYVVPYSRDGYRQAGVFDFWDLERGGAWRWTMPYRPAELDAWSYDRQRAPVHGGGLWFEPANRAAGGPLRVTRLLWHSWNAWYVSGETAGEEGVRGFSLVRRTPFSTG
jgi:hypothetical protein